MSIEISPDLEDFLKRFTAQEVKRRYQIALTAIGEELRDKIAEYPKSPKYPIKWTSRKQFFYVWFILLKQEPYKRIVHPMSQALGKSWAVEVNGLSGFVGTRVTYAPFVQSAKNQQPMHKATGWKTDEQAVKEMSASTIRRLIGEAFGVQ